MIERKKWNKEKCLLEALKYSSRGEFRKYSGSAYGRAIKEKWMDEICVHMIFIKYPKGYWTKEKCQEESIKYKTRGEFSKSSSSAYFKAHDYKWLDDICSHMTIIGNHYKKCIYSYEFDDNYVYVGLTYNIEERKKQHCKRGPVKNHILNTGNLPVFKILTEYILSKDAISKEEEFLNFYKNNGWNTLNIMKTGALGGGKTKWTKEKCQEESIKYNNIKDYKNNSLSYRAAVRNKWLNDICKHMCRVKNSTGYWTKERCIEYSLECKNKKEFEFRYPGGYAACRKNGWIKDISLHMDNRISKEKGYWTKEKCKEEALKYNIRSQFQKNSISSYQTSINNMWLDEICEHMTIKRRLWNKESCLLESLKYKTRGDFVKNSPSAYNKSQKLGWLDEVCLHMIKKDTKLKGH